MQGSEQWSDTRDTSEKCHRGNDYRGQGWNLPKAVCLLSVQRCWWGQVWSQFLHLAPWGGRAQPHRQVFLMFCVSCAQLPPATHRESPPVQGLLPSLATSRQEPTEAGQRAEPGQSLPGCSLGEPHSPWTSLDAALSGCL